MLFMLSMRNIRYQVLFTSCLRKAAVIFYYCTVFDVEVVEAALKLLENFGDKFSEATLGEFSNRDNLTAL